MAQDYKNHRQFVPGFHIITYLLVLLCLIGSIINLSNSFTDHSNLYSASLIVVMNVILGLLAVYARRFALKAQDRAIRAEENLRHFAMAGKLHDPALRTGQIIALRFASDEEYVALSKRALAEKLTNDQIKRQIKSWKADLNRV
jgi:hypothetical protein